MIISIGIDGFRDIELLDVASEDEVLAAVLQILRHIHPKFHAIIFDLQCC